jgi:Na+-translocating ferredoxin:NAD+ oxidoreductase subunit A
LPRAPRRRVPRDPASARKEAILSYLGIVVTSAFASNALLSFGLGSIPVRGSTERQEGPRELASALALAGVNALASSFLWAVHSLLLFPLALDSLDILFFALLAVPSLKFISRAAAYSAANGPLSLVGSKADDLIVGSLVFGVALISARGGYSLPEALTASVASGLGYWLAFALLESVRERLELSDLPRPFRGGAAMLISAGLMAMAFMGLDAAFVQGLAG